MERILYTKYSTERAEKLRIKTQILENDHGRYVLKSPMTESSHAHMEYVYQKYLELCAVYGDSEIVINKCSKNGVNLIFEYITGVTFEEVLDQCLVNKNYLEIIDQIRGYKEKMLSLLPQTDFKYTDGFKEVFGDIAVNMPLKAVSVANIDMIFSNIVVNDSWNLIDYEWTFSFPIPVNFILYRAIVNYLYASNKREELWHLELLQLFGIEGEERNLYDRMDRAFQQYVCGGTYSLQNMCEALNRTKYVVRDLLVTYIPGQVQVFYDYGQGYCEEQSEFINCTKDNGNFVLKIKKLEGVHSLRIDPTNRQCLVKIVEFAAVTGEGEHRKIEFYNNGQSMDENLFVYNTDDPQWVVPKIEEEVHLVQVVFSITDITPEMAMACVEDNVQTYREFLETKQKYYELENHEKDLENSLKLANEELDRRQEELEHRMDVINSVNRTNNDLGQQIEESQKRYENLQRQQEELKQRYEIQEQTISSYVEKIKGIENSVSWKVTKPFRKLLGH